MSPTTSTTSTTQSLSSSIPTAQDVLAAGGVWTTTSAKRDKLAELRAALLEHQQRTLDDLATPEQLYDLWLCDGVAAIATMADFNRLERQQQQQHLETLEDEEDIEIYQIINHLNTWWDQKLSMSLEISQIQFENILQGYAQEIDKHLSALPAVRSLRNVRDYVDINNINTLNPKDPFPMPKEGDAAILEKMPKDFKTALLRYRLQLSRAASQTLKSSWPILTKISDQDIDRAAVQGSDRSSLKVNTLSLPPIRAVLDAFLRGNAQDRFDATWNLLDRDKDTRLDEVEMNRVCELSIAPVQSALQTTWNEAMAASLIRPPSLKNAKQLSGYQEPPLVSPTLSWSQRRREEKEKKRLARIFQKALTQHFSGELEQPHRLRCIYAWANKAHQDNKVESVLVENEDSLSSSLGLGGRKRYVELVPKISLTEFRQVQKEHFAHLDRVGAEYLKSFREDLWVNQGKMRQSRELYRDCAIFMTVVCCADFVISSL